MCIDAMSPCAHPDVISFFVIDWLVIDSLIANTQLIQAVTYYGSLSYIRGSSLIGYRLTDFKRSIPSFNLLLN